jgi:hypothetical protein
MLALAPDTHAKLTQFLFNYADKHGQVTDTHQASGCDLPGKCFIRSLFRNLSRCY